MKKITLSLIVAYISFSNLLADENKLEDITVTAQKFEQNLLDVPISANVYDDIKIEDFKLKSYEDLSQISPNLSIVSYGSGLSGASIRGIATDVGLDASNVAVFVDGIPFLHSSANYIVLDNIDKIEVLRGPQSTLYGKNAYAGAINITTKKPTNDFKSSVRLGLGNDKLREIFANASGAVIKDKFYIGISANHFEKDGFIKNLNTQKYEDFRESNFGKIYLRLTPNENLDISLISSLLKNSDGSPRMLATSNYKAKQTTSDFEGKTRPAIWTNALKVDYTFDDYSINSILTHKDYNEKNQYDADYTSTLDPLKMFHVKNDMPKKEYSFETKFIAKKENFTFLAGFYADDMKKNMNAHVNSMPFINLDTKSNTYSFFLNNDYKINNKLNLILGARYDYDKISMNDILHSVIENDSNGEFSPKIALQYKINSNISSFASIAKGYKMGGYYVYTPPGYSRKFNPETMINYEIGVKTKFEKLQFNTSVFYMDISDKQVANHISAYESFINNAAKATSVGFEIEADYEIVDGLNIFGNFGYSDSKLKDFKDSLGDYSGNQMPFAPKYTYMLGATYRHNSGFFATAMLKAQDKFYSDKQNQMKTDGYSVIDAKIGYETENFDIYLYAKNLTDKVYGYNYGMDYYFADPREFGINFTYRF